MRHALTPVLPILILLMVPRLLLASGTGPAGIHLLLSPGIAPAVVHVNALPITLPVGTPLTARFNWDFGDPHGEYNQLSGFVAAHIYNLPGSYTITLTVIDETGEIQKLQSKVTIEADRRQRCYIASNGMDGNAGNSDQAPLRTLDRAFALLPDHAEVLLKAGGTYPVLNVLKIRRADIVIGKYGDGPDPILMLDKNPNGKSKGFFTIDNNCDGVLFDHLTIDTPFAAPEQGKADKTGFDSIMVRGRNISVRNCTFLNVDTAVNGNGSPTGLLVQNCRAPLPNGLRAYLVWGQGSNLVCLGNYAANSTREHIVRMSGVDYALIYDNDFTNRDRRPADPGDYSKGCIEMHHGSYAWIANNKVTDGYLRVGPLGLKEDASTSTDWCVIENNRVKNNFINAYAGSHHIMIRNNVIQNDKLQSIQLQAPDKQQRTSGDIYILNNTGIDRGTTGAFLKVWGHVNGITMKNNLFVAPNLKVGENGAAAVNINEPDLASFEDLSDNIWPTFTAAGKGNAMLMGNRTVTPADWQANPKVKNSQFKDLTVDDSGKISGDLPAVSGPPLPAVPMDITGASRTHAGIGAISTEK